MLLNSRQKCAHDDDGRDDFIVHKNLPSRKPHAGAFCQSQFLSNHQISPRVFSIFLVFYMWRPMSRQNREKYKYIEEYR
jgi:hypothetical protein